MADGFLGRWAKRKEAVRRGESVPDVAQKAAEASTPRVPPPQPSPGGGGSEVLPSPPGEGRGGGAPQVPAPTLDDTRALTKDSDFTRFVRPDVAPEVKNAALKKLFADPHFNVMDGLDVYIDDYNKPDPLPAAMVRQLAGAKFLGLVEDDEEQQSPPRQDGAGVAADAAPPETVAQSDNGTGAALPPAGDHADPDLRLQQDDAPGPEGPGAGAR